MFSLTMYECMSVSMDDLTVTCIVFFPYCYYFFFSVTFFSKTLQPTSTSIELSDLFLDKICKKITCHFFGRRSRSRDISDFLFWLFTIFLEKYQRQNFQTFSDHRQSAAFAYTDVRIYFRSSSDCNQKTQFFRFSIFFLFQQLLETLL